MPSKYKNIGLLFLILGFIFISLGGFLLIFASIKSIDLMLTISLALIMLGVVIYAILIILFLIYYGKGKDL